MAGENLSLPVALSGSVEGTLADPVPTSDDKITQPSQEVSDLGPELAPDQSPEPAEAPLGESGSPTQDRRQSSDEWGEPPLSLSPSLSLPDAPFSLPNAGQTTDLSPTNRCVQGSAQPLPKAQGLHLCHARLSRRPYRPEHADQVPREARREGLQKHQVDAEWSTQTMGYTKRVELRPACRTSRPGRLQLRVVGVGIALWCWCNDFVVPSSAFPALLILLPAHAYNPVCYHGQSAAIWEEEPAEGRGQNALCPMQDCIITKEPPSTLPRARERRPHDPNA